MSAKLLLIEDDSEISELLSTLLSQEGFSVNTAFDGARGEKLALENEYDAIILDIMLPEKDGLSVLRDIRGQVSTPILMLTAKGDELEQPRGVRGGEGAHLERARGDGALQDPHLRPVPKEPAPRRQGQAAERPHQPPRRALPGP